MQDKMKIAFYMMIAVITVLTIGGMIIGQPETQEEKEAQEEYQFYGQISAEIYFLAVGLVFTSVTTGIGLILSSEESSRSRNERNLSLVGTFSAQLTELKNREKTLKTKRDCDTYALNYVDLMDQIAFLCDKGSIPFNISKYFDNEFGYALNMIEWLEAHEKTTKAALVEAKEKALAAGINYEKHDKNYPWFSLIYWCHYPITTIGSENNPDPIEILDGNPLPQAMENYDNLPEEEVEKILEVINEYSRQLTDLKNKERNLTTQKDCEIYALNYVDLMDQIAYLYGKSSLPRDVSEYFVNDFSYALTMINWLEQHKIISKQPLTTDHTWYSLVNWCRYPDEQIGTSINEIPIEPLKNEALPQSMQDFTELPSEDLDRILEIVKSYGEKLASLTSEEKGLEKGKGKDLQYELYAISYLDLLDNIAFLYRQNVIPENIADYFENNFCYALTLNRYLVRLELADKNEIPIVIKHNNKEKKVGDISCEDWINEEKRKSWVEKTISEKWVKENYTKKEIGKNPKTKATKIQKDSKHIVVGKDYTWTDLMMWCKDKSLTPFDDTQLPPVMRNFLKSKGLKLIIDESRKARKLKTSI